MNKTMEVRETSDWSLSDVGSEGYECATDLDGNCSISFEGIVIGVVHNGKMSVIDSDIEDLANSLLTIMDIGPSLLYLLCSMIALKRVASAYSIPTIYRWNDVPEEHVMVISPLSVYVDCTGLCLADVEPLQGDVDSVKTLLKDLAITNATATTW